MYYLDTCIWLNLFKKETRNGIKYWKIAQAFIEHISSKDTIVVSTIVLKELSYTLGKKKHRLAHTFFQKTDFVKIVKTTDNDYKLARQFESEDLAKISFYDYLHVAIARNHNFHFITRDKQLLLFAQRYIMTSKPEDLLV